MQIKLLGSSNVPDVIFEQQERLHNHQHIFLCEKSEHAFWIRRDGRWMMGRSEHIGNDIQGILKSESQIKTNSPHLVQSWSERIGEDWRRRSAISVVSISGSVSQHPMHALSRLFSTTVSSILSSVPGIPWCAKSSKRIASSKLSHDITKKSRV